MRAGRERGSASVRWAECCASWVSERGFGKGAVTNREKPRRAAQRYEQRRVGSGQPDLAFKAKQCGEKRVASGAVEMRRDLIEQEQRRLAAGPLLQPRMGEDNRDQQRFLLAGRQGLRGRPAGGVGDCQVGAVRSGRRTAGERIDVAAVFERAAEALLGGEGRKFVEPRFD